MPRIHASLAVPALASSPALAAPCKDANGKFDNCGTPGANPI